MIVFIISLRSWSNSLCLLTAFDCSSTVHGLISPNPQTRPDHTRLLIKFLCVEKIGRVPDVVAFLYEYLAERYILDMLHHLTVKVGDVTTTTQVVWVVVELHLLVVVILLEVAIDSLCLGYICSHSSCLRSLQAAVIAAEALAIDIVVVVLAIVRHCKGNANREQYKMNSFIFIAEMQLTLSIIILDLHYKYPFAFYVF